ncbi:MAG: ABC transporter substrate-binding protein [Armatimonadota bacterium]|nr:ABC transporter substrate-binding protein [Armatimonadota bacterium]MDR7450459.1 ABC transporter substrate-binding protein [Armatimonadota bacterium]MDR7466958.1 ABC transporter substrate-binding protein [Armatimonadota bacterium]MDR7493500.1 ABC transporter substrate-binding protein [Armatimonadota bacterium]MDR7498765.1 ABC transporter substrate-binding protein [Armatimonadota bacterium]
MRKWVVLALGVLLVAGWTPVLAQQPIPATVKVGALFDTTGPTSDVGVDYHKGVLDHVRYINEVEGGIRGRVKLDLVWSDYGYRIPDALSLYRKYRDVDRVNAIIGWGTGDTEALKDQISEDQIPYISASYSSHLNDPAKTPYNFYPVSSYSDQLRAVLKFARELADQARISRPKIVFMYPDHPYGRAPIPAGKAYAQELGFEVGPDQIVALTALEARSQVAAVKSFGADFAWIGGTTNSASVIVRDAKAAGLTTKFFVNVWGYDESMIKLIGASAEGVYGSTPHTYFGEPAPGFKTMAEAYTRFRGRLPEFQWGTTQTPAIASYVRGWLNVLLLRRGLEIIVDNWPTYSRLGGFSGPSVRSALETLKDWDPQGLAPAVTLTRTDHRPSTTTRIMQIRSGRITLVKQVTIERRKDWLGF